jgi:tellurite resistance protein TehA-like permease
MPRAFRYVLGASIMFFFLVLSTIGSENISIVATLFNPHSELGGTMLLVSVVAVVAMFVTLLIFVPRVVVVLIRHSEMRLPLNASIAIAGILSLLVSGAWLINLLLIASK